MLNRIIIVLVVFYIFSWFLLTFRITDVPPGINGDEAAMGYNAALVDRTAYDQSGRFLPIFISAQNLTDWKQPITFYSTVLAFKIFGPSYFLLRAVSIIFILISSLIIFLLLKQILGLVYGLVGLLLFITIPSVMIQAHLGLENIAPVMLVSLWILMMANYHESLNVKFLYLGAIFLGLSLFSYPGMRLIVPVYAAISLLFILFIQKSAKKSLQPIFYFILILAIFPIFMLSIKNIYPGAILAYNRPHTVSSYQEFFLPIISSFDLSFLFLKGDLTPYHSTGKHGVFLLASLPLFVLGLYKIALKKNPFFYLILAGFFMTPILFGLVGSGAIHRGSRILAFLPFYVVIVTLGFSVILGFKKKLRSLSLVFIFLLMFVNYFNFLQDYWFEYPKRVESEFARPYHLAFKNLHEESNKLNLTPYMQRGLDGQNPIAFKFFEEIYFQSRLKRWENKDLPKASIILVDLAGIKERNLKEKDFKKLELKNLDYYLLINR